MWMIPKNFVMQWVFYIISYRKFTIAFIIGTRRWRTSLNVTSLLIPRVFHQFLISAWYIAEQSILGQCVLGGMKTFEGLMVLLISSFKLWFVLVLRFWLFYDKILLFLPRLYIQHNWANDMKHFVQMAGSNLLQIALHNAILGLEFLLALCEVAFLSVFWIWRRINAPE